jgi:hypothetical protein
MKVKDKELKEIVDVLNKDCIGKPCYWPRPDPGSFMQGRGYYNTDRKGWVCGTRHAHGCPR